METIVAISGIDHERLERLERLDRQDAADRRDAQEAARRKLERIELQERSDAKDAADAVALGAQVLEDLVSSFGQGHLREGWEGDSPEADKRRLLHQLQELERTMPGGVCDYVRRARTLLQASRDGQNPFDAYAPSVPSGYRLAPGSDEFAQYEAAGRAAARSSAFVIVAGGLGERLGYSGIKLALPSETLTGTCYLELYVRHILALQEPPSSDAVPHNSGAVSIPVIIMTSDDTDAPTRELLSAHRNFGLTSEQLHIIKQGKVPCLADGAASLALDPTDRFALLTKPHGHGDVHALMHTSGLAAKLLAQGCSHLVLLQDTNALVFGGIPAALGVSATHGLVMNTISVPRRAGDASGALMTLTRRTAEDGGSVAAASSAAGVTVNVEYNQLDALVRSSLDPRGDYDDPATGASPFPGNTNQLIFSLPAYAAALQASGGAMPEFVNPKYTDASRTAFKSPTRLECMMQDFPWVLAPGAPVSFTSLDAGFYAPVKNSHADALKKAQSGATTGGAAEGEHAVFAAHRRLLVLAGCTLPPSSKAAIGGVRVDAGPHVVLGASFRPTIGAAVARLVGGGEIEISGRSSLVLDGDVTVHALTLDGGLVIRAAAGARVVVRRLAVANAGDAFVELTDAQLADAATPEVARLRGYARVVREVRELVFDTPGEHVVDET